MDDYLSRFYQLFSLRWDTALWWLDIFVVTLIFYRLLLLVRGPRAWRIVVGVIMFVLVLAISPRINLLELHWILDKAALLGPVALVILLLPELREGLEGFGKLATERIPRLGRPDSRTELKTIEEIVTAVSELAAGSIGAIIVIERTQLLDEINDSGIMLDAIVTSPLLVSIFYEGNPLHDGAVIIRKEKIVSAACRLPLSESTRLSKAVHMRHRAAVGISETSDALAIVVSEERGTISYALDGVLRRLGSEQELLEVLNREVRVEEVMRRRRMRVKEREKTGVAP